MSKSSPLPPSLSIARITALTAALPGSTEAAETIPARVPFTGEELVRLPSASGDDVRGAARTARAAQAGWAATPVDDRCAALLRWHDLVLDRAEDLLDLIQAETGKARGHAFEEVADTANTLRYYARSAAKTLAPRRRRGALPLLTRTTELRHPYGLVGVISPWNYPLTLAASDVIPALVAGNAVLHKPDNQTALTALMVRDLAIAAGVPPQVWQVVVGVPDVVGAAVIDEADHVVFTGSTATGRIVAERAARHLVRADLELGGKNPMIVCADARLPAAVDGAVRGAFGSAGQLCVSIERIYVHRSISDEFTRRFAAATRRLTLGAGYDHRADVGSLAGPEQLTKVRSHIDDAVRRGARVVAGGSPRPEIGPYFYEPTVLTNVPPEALCFREETFGPVVSIYPVADDEEAIAAANDSPYGLSASVYSGHAAHARSVAKRLMVGAVNINEAYAAAWGSVDAPMGGIRASGVGRRHGAEGLQSSTWSQTVAAQRVRPVGEHRLLRGRRYQVVMTASLRALKALRRR